jgi:hypothetical protein
MKALFRLRLGINQQFYWYPILSCGHTGYRYMESRMHLYSALEIHQDACPLCRHAVSHIVGWRCQ